MNLISFARSLARRVAAVAVVLGAAGSAGAADTPVMAAPAVVFPSSAPCPTCAAPAGAPCGPTCTAAGCKTHFGRTKAPYQTHLCPGACFGYFQTQWSKWEDVCPLPYQGQGLSDAPAARTSPVAPVEVKKIPEAKITTDPKPMTDPKLNKDPKGGELPPPRPGSGGTGTSPMPVGRGSAIPAIPQVPNALPIPTGRFGS